MADIPDVSKHNHARWWDEASALIAGGSSSSGELKKAT
jgi:hypothetical protein